MVILLKMNTFRELKQLEYSSVEADFTRQLDDRGMILLLKRRDSFIVIKEAIDYRNQVNLS